MDNTVIKKQSLADIFLIIAEFYKYPDKEFYEQLSSGELINELKDQFEKLDLEVNCFDTKADIPNWHKLKQEYTRCFIGVNLPTAPPIESIYKVWTTDDSAQIPIAKQKGYLMGDAALHVKHLINSLGLEIPQEYNQTTDHLSILLELLAYLIIERKPEEVKLFLQEHFNWLNDFKEKLIQIEATPLFINITDCLITSVEACMLLYKR